MHNNYELCIDLAKKISIYKNISHREKEISTSDNDALLIVKLLMKSKLKYPKLNRDFVKTLLSGEEPWIVNGQKEYIKSPVDINELEEYFLVRFINNQLIHPIYISNIDQFSGKLRKQLEAVMFLYNIASGMEDFEKNYLYIHKEEAISLYESHTEQFPLTTKLDALNKLSFNTNEEIFFNLEQKDIKIIGSYLWQELYQSRKDKDNPFTDWLDIMSSIFGYSDFIDLYFIDNIQKTTFLKYAVDYILSEADYKKTWHDEQKLLIMENDMLRHGIFYKITPDNKAVTRSELDISVFDYYTQNTADSCRSFIEAYDWWSKIDNNVPFSLSRSMIDSIVHFVISNEQNTYDVNTSYQYTWKLLNNCLDRPGLANSLFNHQYDFDFIISLLRRKETAVIAMSRIASSTDIVPNLANNYRNNYRREWENMIWQQALEVFFNHFDVLTPEEVEKYGLLSKLLITLSREAFGRKRDRNRDGKMFLRAAILFLENTTRKYNGSPIPSDLLDLILDQLITNTITELKNTQNGEHFPYPEWFLLFWYLEKLNKSKLNLSHQFNGNIDEFIKVIVNTIIESYQSGLRNKILPESHTFEEDEIFSELNWPLLFKSCDEYELSILLNTLDHSTLINQFRNSKKDSKRNLVYSIRTHLRLLMNIYSNLEDNTLTNSEYVADEMLKIVKHYGFDKKQVNGIFDNINDDDLHITTNLWTDFVIMSNSFPENTYKRFIDITLSSDISLLGKLKLYKDTLSESNRKTIKEKLRSIQGIDKNDFFLFSNVNKALTIALNMKLDHIVKLLIDKYKDIQQKDRKYELNAMMSQMELSKIYHNESKGIAEKEKLINDFELPFERDDNNYSVRGKLTKIIENHKYHLISLLYFETDPEKTYKYLNFLCQNSDSLQHASNRLSARIKIIEKTEHSNHDKNQLYKSAVDEWQNFYIKINKPVRGVFDYCLLLYCYDKMQSNNEFEKLWISLSPNMQMSLDFIETRCTYLQRNGLLVDANIYLNLLEQFHKEIPDDIKNQIIEIRKNLAEDVKVSINKLGVLDALRQDTPSIQEQKNLWNQLARATTEHQASVCCQYPSNNSVENFILSNLVKVINELLKRTKNLHRQITNKKNRNDIKDNIEEENIINDWLTSLLRERMGYLNWSILDQTRMGTADGQNGENGKDAGEIDILVENQNTPVCLIEALRLFYKNTTEINKHLNKISRYDTIGINQIFIITYCYVNKFNQLCNNYIQHVTSINYAGFDVSSLPIKYEKVESKSCYQIYKETRSRNGAPISFYHILLDFKN